MTSLFTRMFVLLMVFAFELVPHTVFAQAQPGVPLPSKSYMSSFTNADYQIIVPKPIEEWNGTLLVYAHGYTLDLGPAAATPWEELAQGLAQAATPWPGQLFATAAGQ